MKNSLICSMVAMSAVSLSASAEDFSWGNVTFQPRAYAGYADYSLKSSDFNLTIVDAKGLVREVRVPVTFNESNASKLQITGPIWGLGGNVAIGRFFSDIYYQSTLDENIYQSTDFIYPDGYIVSGSSVDGKHADWAFSLGYMVNDHWSVFAGYKSGKTEWDQSYEIHSPPPESKIIRTGNTTYDFKQDGPFLGTSYSFFIDPGVLTFKVGYAYLDGKFTEAHVEEGPNGLNFTDDLDGKSNAFSFGMSWTQSITENLGISIGANYHLYKFNLAGGTGYGNAYLDNEPYRSSTRTDGNFTEKLFTVTASAIYRF